MSETFDCKPEQEPSRALAVSPKGQDVRRPAPAQAPQDARTLAVADALHSAYAEASKLVITPDEAKALSADFPDDAFRRGAGGDDRLIYIEHAYLRQRLNQVLGLGAVVPIRRREWVEDFSFKDKRGIDMQAHRVYVDTVLVVRGAVVGEAIGDGVYYPNNPKTNYGDALESAKSGALRRCCKEFGVGLQAWMKGWCAGWEQRNPLGGVRTPEPSPSAAPPIKVAPAPSPEAPKAVQTPSQTKAQRAELENWLQKCKSKLIANTGGEFQWAWWKYAVDQGWILPSERLGDARTEKMFPTVNREGTSETEASAVKADFAAHSAQVAALSDNTPEADVALIKTAFTAAYSDGTEPAPAPESTVPRDADAGRVGEWWREVVVGYGKHKGEKLEDLPKETLFGFWANTTVETEFNGKPKKAEIVERDQQFRKALDAAGLVYKFKKS